MKSPDEQPVEPIWATGEDWQAARAVQAQEYALARLSAALDPEMTTLERELCRAVLHFARPPAP